MDRGECLGVQTVLQRKIGTQSASRANDQLAGDRVGAAVHLCNEAEPFACSGAVPLSRAHRLLSFSCLVQDMQSTAPREPTDKRSWSTNVSCLVGTAHGTGHCTRANVTSPNRGVDRRLDLLWPKGQGHVASV